MKILSDEQYKMNKKAESEKFFSKGSLEGSHVGHMGKGVLVAFMSENGFSPIMEKEELIFSDGTTRLAVNSSGFLEKTQSVKTSGFNFKSYFEKFATTMVKEETEKTAGWSGYFDVESQLDPIVKNLCNQFKDSPLTAMDSGGEASTVSTAEIVEDAISESIETVQKTGNYSQFNRLVLKNIVAIMVDSGFKPDALAPVIDAMAALRDSNRSKKETPTTSGFNFKSFLKKEAHYEGVQGYMVSQTRAWSNCVKCKQDAGKTAQEAWQECINEYGGKKSNEEWSYQYASDVKDKVKKEASSASCPCVTEKQLGAKEDQGPETLTENQIKKDHKECEETTTEKRLEKVRKEACSTTEKQLGDKWEKEVDTLTENQIDKDHEDGDAVAIEKNLEKTRTAACSTTEKQLGDRDNQGPDETSEKQLDGSREDAEEITTEKRLEKVRVEAQKKSDLVKEAQYSHIPTTEEKPSRCQRCDRPIENDRSYCIPCDRRLDNGPFSRALYRAKHPKSDKKEKIASIVSASVPVPGQFGHGLNEEAMKMLKQYGIYPNDLYEYDDPSSHHKDIYTGIQAAKKGNNAALQQALENTFGKNKPWQKVLSDMPTGIVTKESQTAQYQMGLYWNRIRQKQDEGLTPGQAVMAVLAEMQNDGDKIVVQA